MKPIRISRIHLPALALLLAACGGDGPTEQAPVARTCAAPVQLAAGQSADLTADAQGRVRCDLRVDGEAEFLVAFVDTRATQKARTQAEGYGDAFPAYTVAAALGEEVQLGPALQRAAAPAAPDFVLMQTNPPPAGAAALRETPWALDERFGLYDGVSRGVRTARVLRLYDDRFAVAWFEGDAEALLPKFMAQLDSAWAVMRAHGIPVMRGAYADEIPHTSPGAGQYLLVLRAPNSGAAAGWTAAERRLGDLRVWTELKLAAYDTHLRLAELLAHEMGHAWQATYMYRTRPAGVTESHAAAAFWGAEGGADLVAFETIRRAAGIPLAANFDGLALGSASPAARWFARWGQPGGGQLTEGYADAAGFLRRQAALLARAGVPEEEAVREVLRGASDGWYGFDNLNARRPGLTARMQARLGEGWTPEDALLDWALGHAADDRTPDARSQDPTFLRVWQMTGGLGNWVPLATLPGPPGAGSLTERAYGSPGYFVLQARESTTVAAATSVPGARWRILRVR